MHNTPQKLIVKGEVSSIFSGLIATYHSLTVIKSIVFDYTILVPEDFLYIT